MQQYAEPMKFYQVSRFFLYLAPLSVILVSGATLFPFIVVKYAFFRSVVDLALAAFLIGLLVASDEEQRRWGESLRALFRSPLTVAVSIFMLVVLLASLFGYDPSLAFWSNFERGEGGYQILHFYLFFLLLRLLMKDVAAWRRMFWISITAGILMVLYGVLAGMGVQGFVGPPLRAVLNSSLRFQGSLGNAAYVGSYLLFILFFLCYLLPKVRRVEGRVALYILSALFVVVTWLSQTRGSVFGLLAGVWAFLFYISLSRGGRWRRYAAPALMVLTIAVSSLVYFHDTPFVRQLPGARIFNLGLGSSSFQSRLWTWGSAVAGARERPLLGWGPENFSVVFDRHFDPRHYIPGEQSETWYDRAHNLFLDYLAETGMLGLLAFLSVFVVFFLELRKFANGLGEGEHHSRVQHALIFSLPVAYLTQGLVIFDVLPIYLNLFLFLAFAAYLFERSHAHA